MKSGRHRGKYNVESGMVEEVKSCFVKNIKGEGLKAVFGYGFND
jgi:hypothetical protein